MPCEPIRLDGPGGPCVAIFCFRGRRQTCKFCHSRAVSKLCDFTLRKGGKTCDAGMCSACATKVGPDQDYCPTHKHQAPPPQHELFEAQP
jgi:hypothetical protein